MVYEVYELRDIDGNKFKQLKYAIIDMFAGRFLEWHDLRRLGYEDPKIDDEISYSGSVIVKRKEAENITKKLMKKQLSLHRK
jgi:hypothetical protein